MRVQRQRFSTDTRAGDIPSADRLGSVLAALQTQTIVLISGDVLSGKTSFLTQLESHLRPTRVLKLSVDTRSLEEPTFLERLARICETKAKSLPRIFEKIENMSAILIVDNLDRVEGFKNFLSAASKVLKRGRLIATQTDHSWIDPLNEQSVCNFFLRKFNFIESKKYLASVLGDLSLSKKPLHEIVNRVYEETDGHPALLRIFCSQLLQIGKADYFLDCLETSRSIIAQKIWTYLSDESSELLIATHFIEHWRPLERKLVEAISPSDLKRLKSFSLVKDSGEISSALRGCITKHASVYSVTRKTIYNSWVLKYASEFSERDAQIEQICQLRELKKWTQLNQRIASLLLDYSGENRFVEIISFTQPFWQYLNARNFEIRRRSLLHHDNHDQALQETLHIWESKRTVEDRAILARSLARMFFWRGDVKNALHFIRLAKKLSQGHPKELFQSQLVETRIIKLVDPEVCYKKARELLGRISDVNSEGHYYYSEALFECGAAAQMVEDYQEALRLYDLAVNLGTQNHSTVPMMAEFNRIDCLFKKGDVRVALARMNILEEEMKRKEALTLLTYAKIFRIRYLLYSGMGSQAEAEWFQNFRLPPVLHSLSDYDRVFFLFQILIFSGQILISDQIQRLLCNKSYIGKNYYDGKLLSIFYRPLLNACERQEAYSEFISDFVSKTFERLTRSQRLEAIYALLEIGWRRNLDISQSDLSTLINLAKGCPATLFQNFVETLAALIGLRRHQPTVLDGIGIARLREWGSQCQLPLWQLRVEIIVAVMSLRDSDLDGAVRSVATCYSISASIERQEAEMNILDGLARSFSDRDSATPSRFSISQCRIILNANSRTLICNDSVIKFGRRESLFRLLKILAQSRGSALDKEAIAVGVWKEIYNPLIHDLRIHTNVRRLRRFLEPLLKRNLLSVSSHGYSLADDIFIELVN